MIIQLVHVGNEIGTQVFLIPSSLLSLYQAVSEQVLTLDFEYSFIKLIAACFSFLYSNL